MSEEVSERIDDLRTELRADLSGRFGESREDMNRRLRVLEGRLPQRAIALVRSWGRVRRVELERDWELARENRPLRRIAPLD